MRRLGDRPYARGLFGSPDGGRLEPERSLDWVRDPECDGR
jgi:hypothetical protein